MKVKYPLGIQTFAKIIEDGLLYIDKTAIIYDLLTQGSVYFLSRPRRFGKSLLISTLEALFLGRKDLFAGLAITDTDYDFAVYPVIKIDFTRVLVREVADLENFIINTTNTYAKTHDIALELTNYEQRFAELVIKLHQKYQQKVVLLIDEYDQPILSHLNTPLLADIKGSIKGFYASVKSLDEHMKFIFITGVSKFAKISVFSGMNNLSDISMDGCYAALCGITQEEMETRFEREIDSLAIKYALTKEATLAKIKYWYNGYRFEEDAISVYNPYSLFSLLSKQKFNNYWFTTATPTFLLDLLQAKSYDLKDLTKRPITAGMFEAFEPQDMEIQSVLVQTGYLTIKSYNDPLYQLDFPNYEVKKSFYDSVAARYSKLGQGMGEGYLIELIQHLQAGNITDFLTTLKVFFANIPYDISLKHEKYYQSLFYAIFKLIGLTIDAEVHTNDGRIDCVIQTVDTIYIIEFKLSGTKEQALQQIHDKQYALKYQNGTKAIVLLGVEFDQQTRNIGDFLVENLPPVSLLV